MANGTCTIEGCNSPERARTWCSKHYFRWYRTGDPVGRPRLTLFQRMDTKTQIGATEAECWIWTGARTAGGYGAIADKQQMMQLAHRLSYERHVGPIPDGLHLDHLCRNRACVNPRHLEPVTAAVNSLRGVSIPAINARLTHCRRGHPFDGANTRIETDGSRRCLTCKRLTRKR